MPDRGFTVDPVYQDTATGQDIVDVQIRPTGHSAVGRDGVYKGWEQDYRTDAYDHNVYDPKEGFDELGQSPVVGFDESSYTEALLSSNPQISPALDFAVEYMPEEFIDEYNAAVDGGNLDKMHQMLDVILEQYALHNPEQEVEQEVEQQPEEEDLSEDESAEFAGVLDEMTEQEPGGTEAAYGWLEAAQQWSDSDPVMTAVCKASASFHDGTYSAEQLIDDLTSQYSPRELARVYKILNS